MLIGEARSSLREAITEIERADQHQRERTPHRDTLLLWQPERPKSTSVIAWRAESYKPSVVDAEPDRDRERIEVSSLEMRPEMVTDAEHPPRARAGEPCPQPRTLDAMIC